MFKTTLAIALSLRLASIAQTSALPTISSTDSLIPVSTLQFNNTSDNLTSTNQENLFCLKEYGRDLHYASCLDAISQIESENDDRPKTVGFREVGNFDIPLPYRYISSKPSLPKRTLVEWQESVLTTFRRWRVHLRYFFAWLTHQ